MPGSIEDRNIFAELASVDIGICTYASPANTIRPTLSLSKPSITLDNICFARCIRLGFKSCDDIELETSIATMTSMPLRLTVSNLVPNCGPAITKTIKVNAMKLDKNLTLGLQWETSGMSADNSLFSPNLSNLRLFTIKP